MRSGVVERRRLKQECDYLLSVFFLRSAYYVRVVYNGDEVTWPGLAAGEMCDLGHLTEYILARFMQHHPDIDCAVLADGVGKGAAPETAGSQFA
jgi:hypothetical protein